MVGGAQKTDCLWGMGWTSAGKNPQEHLTNSNFFFFFNKTGKIGVYIFQTAADLIINIIPDKFYIKMKILSSS